MFFTLVQKAKRSGGDKYKSDTNESFVIYVPQTISRKNGNEPAEKLEVNINVIESV